jgi:hypothetical protein
VSLTAWFKRHFALGILLSGATGSILAWMVLERKWPWFFAPVHGVFSILWSWIITAWGWTVGVTPVYRWWYAVLLLYLAATLVGIAYTLIKTYIASAPDNPLQYTQDTIFGVVWRWTYKKHKRFDGYDNEVYEPTPFCPICDRGLHGERRTISVLGTYGERDALTCREHGIIYHSEHSLKRAIQIVKDEILLKLRDGSWKQVVERLKASG